MRGLRTVCGIVAVLAPLIAGAQQTKPLTNQDVIGMVKEGLSAAAIEQKINSSECAFKLGSDDLVGLNDANVPQRVVKVMLARQAAPSGSAQPGASGATASKMVFPPPGFESIRQQCSEADWYCDSSPRSIKFSLPTDASIPGCVAALSLDEKGVSFRSCSSEGDSDFALRWGEVRWVCTETTMRGLYYFGTDHGTYRATTYKRLGLRGSGKMISLLKDLIGSLTIEIRGDCGKAVNSPPG
jgi:hypothetical protein